jgi:cytochrome c oxidase cbb3-type subunit III
MSSRCPPRDGRPRGWLLALALAAGGCDREDRAVRGTPLPEGAPARWLALGGEDPRGDQYRDSAFHINEGARLFRWFNCAGCHANGGGGMGPALMDSHWRYGSSMDQIHRSIADGRPNGMPSFAPHATRTQLWQLAAYVRALSGNVAKDAPPSRREALSGPPPLTRLPEQPVLPGDPALPRPPRPPQTFPGPAATARDDAAAALAPEAAAAPPAPEPRR